MNRVFRASIFFILCSGCGFTNEPDPGISSPFDMGFGSADESIGNPDGMFGEALAMDGATSAAPGGPGADFDDAGMAAMLDDGVSSSEPEVEMMANEGALPPSSGQNDFGDDVDEGRGNDMEDDVSVASEDEGEASVAGGSEASTGGSEENNGGAEDVAGSDEVGGADFSDEATAGVEADGAMTTNACLDVGGEFENLCSASEQPTARFAVVDSQCQAVDVCGPLEAPFFDSLEACQMECEEPPPPSGGCICPAIYAPVCGGDGQTYSNRCAANCAGISETTDGECSAGTCDDLQGVDFGACRAILGFGVVDGQCATISGCGVGEASLFSSQEDCESSCPVR